MSVLWVALGGAAGASARFLAAEGIAKCVDKPFPAGTLAINVLGSFFIGVCYWLLIHQQVGGEVSRHLFMVGFLGAFTTFSTFSLETLMLLQQGRYTAAFGYIASSLLICLAATALGMKLTKSLV